MLNLRHFRWLLLMPFLVGLPLCAQEPKAAAPKKELSLADLIEQAEPACVRIDVKYKDKSKGIGSGFVVDAQRRWVVTNYHVVADSEAATVSFADGTKAEVEGWRAHYTERDLALLQIVTKKTLSAIPVAAEIPRKGERTVAIGTPQGLSFTATEGIISAIRSGGELEQFMTTPDAGNPDQAKFKLLGTWLQTSTPISPGSSGGPLLNLKGEVVGINSGSLASGQNINFAVSCKDIQRLVDVGKRIRLRTLSVLTPSSKTRLGIRGSSGAGGSGGETIVIKVPAEKRYRHRYKIEMEEDEFDKMTVLRTEWLPVEHDNRELTSLGVRVSVIFDEEDVAPLAFWEVGVTARTFQFLGRDATRFQVLGGDESYELPQGKPERKIERGGTSEVIKGITGLDVFVDVAMSDTVKARLGSTEMEFDKRQVECLRDLASRIPRGTFFEGKLRIESMEADDDSR